MPPTPGAPPRRILPVLVFSQFAGTAPWFATNAVMPDLQQVWALPATAVATVASAVQLGFVAGTLVFALAMVADRLRPTRVFATCCLAAAALNAATVLARGDLAALVALRFLVGFVLAGIYPVGMRIAAAWFPGGLGGALGLLVGALVLGTALPHGLRAVVASSGGRDLPWEAVVHGVSLLAASGGLATWLLIPDRRLPAGPPPTLRALGPAWSDRRLRASVLGYFGHMWELYAFIVLVPAILASRMAAGAAASALAFATIAAGALGCVFGGLAAARSGSARVAAAQLATSGLCCVLAPVMLQAPLPAFVVWLLVWGTTVAGDSPQFSALTARNAPPAVVGSVLTFATCIGFAISICSIELSGHATAAMPLAAVLPLLAIGPVAGLLAMRPLLAGRTADAGGSPREQPRSAGAAPLSRLQRLLRRRPRRGPSGPGSAPR